LRLISNDEGFAELYEPLTRDLQGQGVVYLPHPHIPPNARIATPIAKEAIVYLRSSASFSVVYAALRSYLLRDPNVNVRVEGPSGEVDVSARSLFTEDQLRQEVLVPTGSAGVPPI
jgi:hypothetical protein